MKLLFDQNLSFKLVDRLADLFPDSDQVRRLGLDQADDRAIWEHAKRSGFVLVTQDSDFADLAALLGPPPKVIWLRCGNQPTQGRGTPPQSRPGHRSAGSRHRRELPGDFLSTNGRQGHVGST